MKFGCEMRHRHSYSWGSVEDNGVEELEVTFQFPAAVPPLSQPCCRAFLLFWFSWTVLHRERLSTSGAAAMGPNTAPAQLPANTTNTHTETHTHTYVLKCCRVMALNSLSLTRHLCKQEAKQYFMYIFINAESYFYSVQQSRQRVILLQKKSFQLKCSLKAS